MGRAVYVDAVMQSCCSRKTGQTPYMYSEMTRLESYERHAKQHEVKWEDEGHALVSAGVEKGVRRRPTVREWVGGSGGKMREDMRTSRVE